MEESSAQCQGVLSPKLNNVQAPKTPVAERTRSTRSDKDNEDQQQFTQTPRRSTRKSVRPPKDYFDIMRSASKRKPEIPADINEDVNQEDEPLKKNKSEGGRKKNAKRKARKTKNSKVNSAEKVTDQRNEQEEEDKPQEKKEQPKDVTETKQKKEKKMKQQQKQDQEIEQELKKEEDQETEQQREREEDQEIEEQLNKEQEAKDIQKKKQEENKGTKKQDIAPRGESVSCVKASPELEQDKTVGEQGSPVGEPTESPGSIIISDDELKLSTAQAKTSHMEIDEDDLEELGLKPLNRDEEKEEDIPSLIVLDDEMGEEQDDDVLNRTFDAEPENAVEQPETKSTNNSEPVAAIKIVLTDAQDQDTTILNPNNNSILVTNKPKAFKFPTPLKANSKPSLMFSVGDTSARKTQLAMYNKELEDSCSIRRRSKSFTDITETRNKTVTIFSPIEVMSTADIDKRWDCLDVSNVTQRRRRSKSLDSRIPKPKLMALTKSNTPGKLKARKKVPNFAAIHQKQFDNMENLEEHIERKKARAKELTSSALKQLPRVESVQKKLPAAAAVQTARSKAVKKIEIPANTPQKRMVALTPMKVDAIPRQKNEIQIKSRLPVPTVSNIFTSTSVPAVPSQPVDRGFPLQNKAEARRQRHMEMFKGRTIKEKKTDIIRGVRSNRRFELQMKHRQQLEEKKI